MPNKPKRDQHGRWPPGTSGNKRGRPKKEVRVDTGNFLRFKNEVIDVPTPEGTVKMTREAANQHRFFQAAMKGNVQALKHFNRKFEEYEERRAQILAAMRKVTDRMEADEKLTEAEMSYVETALRFFNGETSADEGTLTPPGARKPGRFDDEVSKQTKKRFEDALEVLRKQAEQEELQERSAQEQKERAQPEESGNK